MVAFLVVGVPFFFLFFLTCSFWCDLGQFAVIISFREIYDVSS